MHVRTYDVVARIINSKSGVDGYTNKTECGTEPTEANWVTCEKELIGYVKGNVTMVMNHSAVGK